MTDTNTEKLDSKNEEVEVDTEETTEEDVETEEEETEEETETEEEVDIEAVLEENKILKEKNKKLFERAKKAEGIKKTTAKETVPTKKTEINKTPSQTDVEAVVLKAQGFSDSDLEDLKKVAQVTGKSLLDAKVDPIYVAIKEKKDADEKSKKASLGTSKNARAVQQKKSIDSPGLTDEEHKALWKERMGQ